MDLFNLYLMMDPLFLLSNLLKMQSMQFYKLIKLTLEEINFVLHQS